PSRRFPSSQSSPRTMPSPQVEVHGCPLTQVGSASQRSLQPSKGTLLPSSQLSAPSILPSPHTYFVHLLGEPSHLCPRSMRQRESQPSPSLTPPSSQPSFGSTFPSPQT